MYWLPNEVPVFSRNQGSEGSHIGRCPGHSARQYPAQSSVFMICLQGKQVHWFGLGLETRQMTCNPKSLIQ